MPGLFGKAVQGAQAAKSKLAGPGGGGKATLGRMFAKPLAKAQAAKQAGGGKGIFRRMSGKR